MQTKTYQVYKFEELTKEQQQLAIRNNRDINIDYYWEYWETGFLDSDIFSNDMKKYFDLDRANYIQFPELDVKNYKKFYKLLKIPQKLGENLSFRFEHPRHSNTKLYFTQFDNDKFDTPKNNLICERAIKIFATLMDKVLKQLKEAYEYETSDEAVIITLTNNDYNFTVDGKID